MTVVGRLSVRVDSYLALFYIHQLNQVNSRNYFVTMTTPQHCPVYVFMYVCVFNAAFTPAQLVAGNKHHVARSKLLVTRNKLRVARNTQLVARNKHQVARNLLRATCCAGVNAA